MKNSEMEKPDQQYGKPAKLVPQESGYPFIVSILVLILCVTMSDASSGGSTSEGERNWLDFAWRTFNFAVLAGLLYWLLAAKVKDFFGGRLNDIKKSLLEANLAKEEAKRKFAEYDAKLEKASKEIQELEEMIHSQGLAERERIIAEALRNAEKMKDDARKRIEQEMKMARNELRIEAGHLSIKMAEEILQKHITAADNISLVGEYIAKVGEKH